MPNIGAGLIDQPESLPNSMYTIPASESNYQYDGTGSSKMLEQMTVGLENLQLKPTKHETEKYKRDPKAELQDEIEENTDMQDFFEDQLPKHSDSEIEMVKSKEDMQNQIELILL